MPIFFRFRSDGGHNRRFFLNIAENGCFTAFFRYFPGARGCLRRLNALHSGHGTANRNRGGIPDVGGFRPHSGCLGFLCVGARGHGGDVARHHLRVADLFPFFSGRDRRRPVADPRAHSSRFRQSGTDYGAGAFGAAGVGPTIVFLSVLRWAKRSMVEASVILNCLNFMS